MKYPRTLHLPNSYGGTGDDKRLSSWDILKDRHLLATVKMDGSNVCMTETECFSRSHNGSPTHPSFSMFKQLHATVRHNIIDGMAIYGEWLYAKHSIEYKELPSYFLVFAVFDMEMDTWLPWSDVEFMAKMIDCPTVPVLGDIKTGEHPHIVLSDFIMDNLKKPVYGNEIEGFVFRSQSGFKRFDSNVFKWVRENHVQTDEHWKDQAIVVNGLCKLDKNNM